MRFQTIKPATGEVLSQWETMPRDRVFGIAAQTRAAFLEWRDLPVAERAACLVNLAAVLRENLEGWARLITLEMGKAIGESRGEIEKCAWLCEVYADRAAEWLADEPVEADGERHLVTYEPLGVVFSIMPWNYPFWQAFRFAVPGLVAGNTSLLKHASNVTGCAFAIEHAFREAGFPEDTFRTIVPDYDTVAALIASDLVAGVSLTGSNPVGARIGEIAGRNVKKMVLELGGSDPFIVLEDADVGFAAKGATTGRTIATGQSCIASKRFIVVESVAEAFTEAFVTGMSALRVGDPLDDETQVGAIVNEASLVELEEQLADAVEKGAKVLCGGKRLDRPGFFLPPTVVTDVTTDMRLFREEVFGPIAPVIVVKDEEEAIRLANDSEFGLAGSIWTKDLDRGVRIARRVESGCLFVNSFSKSDPRMPFGGVKKSGIGRELSRFGLREFTNVKGISVYPHGS
jgi:succinate-semialdehyde dehydrogenase/glutarate-semialdehyde dehydrogenase